MKYIYETHVNYVRMSTSTNFEQALKDAAKYVKGLVLVYDAEKGSNLPVFSINTKEDEAEWRRKLEQDSAWKPEKREKPAIERRWNPMENLLDEHTPPESNEKTAVEKAVDPSHYKSYIDDYQWLDAMSRIPTLRNPECFCAALELQIRKYLDRNGGKDASVQELKKARFYLEYMIQYMEGKKVSAARVHEKLKD